MEPFRPFSLGVFFLGCAFHACAQNMLCREGCLSKYLPTLTSGWAHCPSSRTAKKATRLHKRSQPKNMTIPPEVACDIPPHAIDMLPCRTCSAVLLWNQDARSSADLRGPDIAPKAHPQKRQIGIGISTWWSTDVGSCGILLMSSRIAFAVESHSTV